MENRNILFMKELFVSNNDWDSHRELLYAALNNTNRAIAEFGVGEGSTPLIRGFGVIGNRRTYHYENNRDWMFRIGGPTEFVRDWNEVELPSDVELLFVDCAPGEARKDLIAKFANDAKVIVVHDTEPGAEYVYGMKDVLNSFKYRLDYKPEGKPHTTAVSNFVNVTEWL
jgi:hypothetical protein